MAKERGIVTKVTDRTAWVKTSRTSACEGCTSRGSCHIAEGGKEMEVEAFNEVGAKVGDRIEISIASSSLLKVSFLLYVFPIILMLFGAIVGQSLAPRFDLNPSALSAAVGIGSFVIAFWIIRIKSNKLAQKEEYRPRIIRILRQPPAAT
jgi:sigma-E factor negative regulatory protein RseC